MQGSLAGVSAEDRVQLKLKQGRPHVLIDYRIVDDQGREQPWDGKAFGDLQARGADPPRFARLADAPQKCLMLDRWRAHPCANGTWRRAAELSCPVWCALLSRGPVNLVLACSLRCAGDGGTLSLLARALLAGD